MATLTGQQIDQSYLGLLKTNDNAAIGATAKAIQDGAGGATNIEMSTTATNFVSGTVDFTGSTVSGLPAASAGLEAGTGTDSMQSSAALTSTAADASGNGSIALGDGASATRQESVAIGQGAEANGSGSEGSIAIGHGSVASANRGIAIGINGTTNSSEGIVIGDNVDISGSDRSVGIGNAINLSGGSDKVAIGTSAAVTGNRGLAFGQNASATATEAIAMGYNVTAATANTLSVNALETQTDGGVSIKGDGTNAGKLKLFCEDAGGAHNITLEGPAHAGGATYGIKFPNVQSAGSQILEADSSGNLAWINTPSGGGGAAGLVTGGQTNSMKSAAALTTTGATTLHDGDIVIGNGAASTVTASSDSYNLGKAIAIGDGATVNKKVDFNFADTRGGIAIGAGSLAVSNVNNGGGLAIGENSDGTGAASVAIGNSSQALNDESVAIGFQADAAGGSSIAIGKNADTSAGWSIAIGETATVTAGGFRTGGIAIGTNTSVSAIDAVALGNESGASAAGAIALGHNVQATIAETASVSALEVQTDSTPTAGGIIMSDAGGTDRRLNINASGGLQIDSSPVGAATQFELSGFTVPANAASDICYAVVTIPANTFAAGDILEFRSLEKRDSLNNTVYESYWFSTQSQTVGSAVQSGTNSQQAGIQTSSNGTVYYQKTLWIGASGTTVYPYGRANETSTGVVQSGDPVETQTIDWTTTQYFYYQGWSDATVGTVENYGTILRKLN